LADGLLPFTIFCLIGSWKKLVFLFDVQGRELPASDVGKSISDKRVVDPRWCIHLEILAVYEQFRILSSPDKTGIASINYEAIYPTRKRKEFGRCKVNVSLTFVSIW
jgi:hypothetical protein